MKTMFAIVMWAITFMLTSAACAGTKSLVVIATPGQRPVAATVMRKADFVACPVSLSSDKKEPEERFADIQAATRMIVSAAQQNPKILIHSGPVSLSGETQSSFSLSKLSSGYDAYSTARLHILVPAGDGKPDVFAGGLTIKEFLAGVKLPEKIKCSLGQIQLAVDNPEQHRQDILKAIAESIKQARGVLAQDGQIEVIGLASPVMARQADDENIELFIHYSLSLSGKGKE